MQYQSRDGLYRAIRVTGPTHHLLGIAVTPASGAGCADGAPKAELEVLGTEAAGADSAGKNSPLQTVKDQVLQGVAQANDELGTQWQVSRIQVVATDDLHADAYREMARRIILRLQRTGSAFDGHDG